MVGVVAARVTAQFLNFSIQVITAGGGGGGAAGGGGGGPLPLQLGHSQLMVESVQ